MSREIIQVRYMTKNNGKGKETERERKTKNKKN